ncbi:hypothetical protein CBR_g74539, partial [Chara braunii]
GEEKECGHVWGQSDVLRQIAGIQRRGGDDDGACSSGSDAEDMFENLLGVIDTLHIRVENLRNQLGRNHSSRKAAAARLLALQLQQPNLPRPPSTGLLVPVQRSATATGCLSVSPSKLLAAEIGTHIVKSEPLLPTVQPVGAGRGGRLSVAIPVSGLEAPPLLRSSCLPLPIATGFLESRTESLSDRPGEDLMTATTSLPSSAATVYEAFASGGKVGGGRNTIGVSRAGLVTAAGRVDQNCTDHSNNNLSAQLYGPHNGVFGVPLAMGNDALVASATKGLPVAFHHVLELDQVMGGTTARSLEGKDDVHSSHSNGLEGLAANIANDSSEDATEDIGMYLVSTGGDCSPLERCLFLSGSEGNEQATVGVGRSQVTQLCSTDLKSESMKGEGDRNAASGACLMKTINDTWPARPEREEGQVSPMLAGTWHAIEKGLLLGFSAGSGNCLSLPVPAPIPVDVAALTSPSGMASQSESRSLSQRLSMTQGEPCAAEGQLQAVSAFDEQPAKLAFPQGRRRKRESGGNSVGVPVPVSTGAMDVPWKGASPRSAGSGSRRNKGQGDEKERDGSEREQEKEGSLGSVSHLSNNGPEDTIVGASGTGAAVVSPARRETRALARQAVGHATPKTEPYASPVVPGVSSKPAIAKGGVKAGRVVMGRGRGKGLANAKGSLGGCSG